MRVYPTMKPITLLLAVLTLTIAACSDPVSSVAVHKKTRLDSVNIASAPCAIVVKVTQCTGRIIDSIAITVAPDSSTQRKLVGLMNSGSSTTVRLYPGVWDITAKGRTAGDWHSVIEVEAADTSGEVIFTCH